MDFKPEEDDTNIKKRMMKQIQAQLGENLFDGTMLFSPRRFQEPFELTVNNEVRFFFCFFYEYS